MLQLKANLLRKENAYEPRICVVEKVIPMYGRSFEQFRLDLLEDNLCIHKYKDLMYIDSENNAHCLLFVDQNSGDGILVESEGADYARYSQYIPNAQAIIQQSEQTQAEQKLHGLFRNISEQIANDLHNGKTSFCLQDYMEKTDMEELVRGSVRELLDRRADIQQVQDVSLDVPFQPDFQITAKPVQELKFYCPLTIRREPDYDEFMRSYALIRNVHIDRNLFSDTSTKNNIDLAAWALNAYESGWGYVPYTMGEILTEDVLADLPPSAVTEECKKWVNRRTTDNSRLLRSYLFYDFDSKEFIDIGGVISALSADAWIHVSEESGGMVTMPETIGIALVDGETVGVYVGNGEVVYAKSISDGIVKEPVSQRNWQNWFCVPSVSYPQTAVEFQPYDPNVKNNLDLVQWAIQAYENGWGYVYGTYGNVLTEDVLQSRISVFGHHVTNYLDFIRQNWMGKRTADCVGLIKGYGWYDSASGEIIVGSNGMMDVTANGMFEAAAVKGTIDTIPEVPGLAVWQNGHIGIYIGNGEVIEAMGTQYGVVKTALPDNWTHWLQIPYIAYAE